MRKLPFLLSIIVCALSLSSQTDTIYTKRNGDIICKVTKKTSMQIFYTEMGVGKSISLADVSRTSNLSHLTGKNVAETVVQNAPKEEPRTIKHKKDETDTLYLRTNGATIICKVTKKTDLSYFYNEGGVGKSIEVAEVVKTSNIQAVLDKDKPKAPRPKMPEGCEIGKKADKSDNSINYIYEFASGCKFIKKVIGSDTTYFADLSATGKTEDNYGRGLIINFKDGTNITKNDVDVSCKRGSGELYDYTVHAKLSADDVKTIQSKITVSYKLYKTNRVTGESMGAKMKEGMHCLTYAP
jgi:hypothetical protein